jgi:hypothetical protein
MKRSDGKWRCFKAKSRWWVVAPNQWIADQVLPTFDDVLAHYNPDPMESYVDFCNYGR